MQIPDIRVHVSGLGGSVGLSVRTYRLILDVPVSVHVGRTDRRFLRLLLPLVSGWKASVTLGFLRDTSIAVAYCQAIAGRLPAEDADPAHVLPAAPLPIFSVGARGMRA